MSDPNTNRLFNTIQDRLIAAYDFTGTEHQRHLKNFRFRASVYGVLMEDSEILFKQPPAINQLDLPGGGVEMGETITTALSREFKEETGLDVEPDQLLSVEDSFFTSEAEDVHGILIFYAVRKKGGKLTLNDKEATKFVFLDVLTLELGLIHKSCWNVINLLKNKVR